MAPRLRYNKLTTLTGTEEEDKDIMKFSPTTNKRTISIPQAIVLAAMSASIGVFVTALICARFVVNPSYFNGFDSIISSSVVTTRSTSIRTRGGLLQASTDVSNSESALTLASTSEDEPQVPKVVWLMSFPNSGTSYTLHLTREASNTTTATNYALEGDIKDQPSVPIHDGATEGPFLQLTRELVTAVPSKYILTKTHCHAFCADCKPHNYLETPRSFEVSCRSGKRAVLDEAGHLTKTKVTYDQSLVEKAVHMFRNPLDNVVARFHLEYNTAKVKKGAIWTETHPNNQEGFVIWCKEMDKSSQLSKMRWIDPQLMSLLRNVPCHEEFFRYVQWHNLAFDVTRGRGIPVHVIQYQQYSENFEDTLTDLLEFLELPRTGKVEPFHAGKEYSSYYTTEQRVAIKRVIQEFASVDTWENVKDFAY